MENQKKTFHQTSKQRRLRVPVLRWRELFSEFLAVLCNEFEMTGKGRVNGPRTPAWLNGGNHEEKGGISHYTGPHGCVHRSIKTHGEEATFALTTRTVDRDESRGSCPYSPVYKSHSSTRCTPTLASFFWYEVKYFL